MDERYFKITGKNYDSPRSVFKQNLKDIKFHYSMNNIINYLDFEKVDIRVGTIIEVEENNNLKKPSLILKINFGNSLGIKKSSAQLKANYSISQLMNKQVTAVVNFKPKQIGNLISEVLVLGFPDDNNKPILISPDRNIKNGGKLF